MSRINHECGTCGHRAELHNSIHTRCTCCTRRGERDDKSEGNFDPTGPITIVDTYDFAGRTEPHHYHPGERRLIGGGPAATHSCDDCIKADQQLATA